MLEAVSRPLEMSARPEARVGRTLNGKWHVDRLLEVGGMGAVYTATHRNGRHAAIKVLLPKFAADPEVRRRFLREGYVANKIGHPGAVAILDDDLSEDGEPYLVMELLEGESLSGWLARSGGRLPVAEVLAIAGQVLEVLDVAHANGVIHRDIKPGNIFVTKGGHAKLLDFGLARIRDGTISLIPTAQGVVMGTAGYMAPEQARGTPDAIDARSDLFAVGAVMYRALSGRRIHEEPTPLDMTLAAMKKPVMPLSTFVPDAAPSLATAVDRALSFRKEDRWQSARAMFEGLRSAYEEVCGRRPATARSLRPRPSNEEGLDVSVTFESPDPPSLVVDVAFGEEHDEVIARERDRMRAVAESLSNASLTMASGPLGGS
jgi:serine/threonine-protein kinase